MVWPFKELNHYRSGCCLCLTQGVEIYCSVVGLFRNERTTKYLQSQRVPITKESAALEQRKPSALVMANRKAYKNSSKEQFESAESKEFRKMHIEIAGGHC
jgi:hypothetical protein